MQAPAEVLYSQKPASRRINPFHSICRSTSTVNCFPYMPLSGFLVTDSTSPSHWTEDILRGSNFRTDMKTRHAKKRNEIDMRIHVRVVFISRVQYTMSCLCPNFRTKLT